MEQTTVFEGSTSLEDIELVRTCQQMDNSCQQNMGQVLSSQLLGSNYQMGSLLDLISLCFDNSSPADIKEVLISCCLDSNNPQGK